MSMQDIPNEIRSAASYYGEEVLYVVSTRGKTINPTSAMNATCPLRGRGMRSSLCTVMSNKTSTSWIE